MNGILRGYKAPKNFDRYLMDIAVSSQGLNSLPSIELPIVSRMQGEYGLDEMLAMQKNHEIEQIQGFTSTAYETQKQFGNVQIVYENVYGVNVAALSKFPYEKEYLIPPSTQIKYTGHKIVEGRHVFTAEGANVLLDTKQEISPTKRVEKRVNLLVEQTEKQLIDKGNFSIKEAESFVKQVIDLNVQHGVINNAEKDLYFKKDKSGKSIFERDVKALTEAPKELVLRDKLLKGASSVLESLGFKKLSNILKEKISTKGQEIIRERPKQHLHNLVKNIREGLGSHIVTTKASNSPTPVSHSKGKTSGGISM